MIRQASVSDLISGRVSRDDGYVVVTMRRYPRFVHRELRDEYLAVMAPEWKLFEDWLSAKRKFRDHEGAFWRVKYEDRFELSPEKLEQLERLSKMSRKKDVYLVCQCRVGERCHRELLLLAARKFYGAKVEGPYHRYPRFVARLSARPVARGIRPGSAKRRPSRPRRARTG